MNNSRRNGTQNLKNKFFLLMCVMTIMLSTGCIQEKLADPQLPAGAPKTLVRWTCTVRAPIGTWKYKVGLNSKLYNSQWTTNEWEVTSSYDPYLPVQSVKINPTYPAPATGEVAAYGNQTFRFYEDNSDMKKKLQSGESLTTASLLFEPFNYHPGKDFFINQVVARFFLYQSAYSDKYGNITNAAVAGDFNQWGKGGERNKNEFKDDGVWPDAKANDGVWTAEVPLPDYNTNSTSSSTSSKSNVTFEYKFYLNPQWDATAGQWQDKSYQAVYDLANSKNSNEDNSGNSLISLP